MSATTPMDPRVLDKMMPFMVSYCDLLLQLLYMCVRTYTFDVLMFFFVY